MEVIPQEILRLILTDSVDLYCARFVNRRWAKLASKSIHRLRSVIHFCAERNFLNILQYLKSIYPNK
jgi:hypothetical protein